MHACMCVCVCLCVCVCGTCKITGGVAGQFRMLYVALYCQTLCQPLDVKPSLVSRP